MRVGRDRVARLIQQAGLRARKAVGWAMSPRMKEDLTKTALANGLASTPPRYRLLHHSYRGRLLLQHRTRRSMSREGHC